MSVSATITGLKRLKALLTILLATASLFVIGVFAFWSISRKNSWYGKCYSAARQTSFIVSNASYGYFPTAVSAFKRSPSVPSITAECISDISALVAKGLKTIDSKNCEAKITGFPA